MNARLFLMVILILFEFRACQAQDADSSYVVLLGTGTPNAEPEKSGTALAVVVDGVAYLVDMGPGLVRRANQAHLELGLLELSPEKLNHVFVSHLHSDHTLGFADLLFTSWTLGRNEKLKVFGPLGIRAMSENIRKAYREDISMRVDGLEPANDLGHRIEVSEIKAGVVLENSSVKIEAFRVHHGSWEQAFGFRFTTKNKVFVISGDAAPSPAIEEMCQSCDYLFHEVYSDAGFQKRTTVWQNYHSQFHTSTLELAEIAIRAKPKNLILYHQLYWGSTDQDLLDEISTRYKGKVISGSDLDVFR